jgi:hypothetical protein
MKKMLSLSALSFVMMATPALAQNRGVVVLTPGASSNWVQQQPTAFLGTEMAQVLPDGLGYVSTGGAIGALPGAALNYRRGMGNRGELSLGASLGLNTGAATAFGAGLAGGWKQQLTGGPNMAMALNVGLSVLGIGSGTTPIGATLGLPLTFDAGLGHITVHPSVNLPNLAGGTTAGTVDASLGLMTPLASNWQLLAEISPTVGFGGGFTLPVGIGARFSPTATSHLDFTVGNISSISPFAAGLGLVGVTGHIGF